MSKKSDKDVSRDENGAAGVDLLGVEDDMAPLKARYLEAFRAGASPSELLNQVMNEANAGEIMHGEAYLLMDYIEELADAGRAPEPEAEAVADPELQEQPAKPLVDDTEEEREPFVDDPYFDEEGGDTSVDAFDEVPADVREEHRAFYDVYFDAMKLFLASYDCRSMETWLVSVIVALYRATIYASVPFIIFLLIRFAVNRHQEWFSSIIIDWPVVETVASVLFVILYGGVGIIVAYIFVYHFLFIMGDELTKRNHEMDERDREEEGEKRD